VQLRSAAILIEELEQIIDNLHSVIKLAMLDVGGDLEHRRCRLRTRSKTNHAPKADEPRGAAAAHLIVEQRAQLPKVNRIRYDTAGLLSYFMHQP
jgi:hypothetical protein